MSETPERGPRIYQMKGSEGAGYIPDLVPQAAQQLAWGALGSRKAVEDEIDLMLDTLRDFWQREPDERMAILSAFSARCTQLAIHLHRLEGLREWRQVRTQQVERLLAEIDRQFKIASREVEVRRQDLELQR